MDWSIFKPSIFCRALYGVLLVAIDLQIVSG